MCIKMKAVYILGIHKLFFSLSNSKGSAFILFFTYNWNV
uniref:Uncharacterized protein n=1 Tax=Brassica oleracea TaxID=3712 RepID=A0A3P6EMH4_BRAOL|nr:unnamed protein product [Brassica oleracea]